MHTKPIVQMIVFFLLINFYALDVFAEKTDRSKIEERLYELEHKVKIIDSNQLNYKIEKDLLKETYSNNYDRINIFITIILSIFAVLGYLGIRNISTTKEKYEKELSKIIELKNQFDLKSNEFENDKKKIDIDLNSIIQENQEQSKKIKFIELKEKMFSLYEQNKLPSALEFANAALVINPLDSTCLNIKGSVLTRLNQLTDALDVFSKCLENNPDNSTTILNYTEVLYFSGRIKEAKELVEKYNDIFKEKYEGELLEFFNLIELYHQGENEKLKEIAKGYVRYNTLEVTVKKLGDWELTDAQLFAYNLVDGDLKTTFQNIVWYWNKKINGRELLTKLDIPLPTQPEEEKKK